jgi:hypothetical protein
MQTHPSLNSSRTHFVLPVTHLNASFSAKTHYLSLDSYRHVFRCIRYSRIVFLSSTSVERSLQRPSSVELHSKHTNMYIPNTHFYCFQTKCFLCRQHALFTDTSLVECLLYTSLVHFLLNKHVFI